MGQYDRAIATAKRMIAKYGQKVTFKKYSLTTGLYTDFIIDMVFISPSASGESQFGKELLQYLSGTQVSSGDLRGYCGTFGEVPNLNDIFVRDGKELVTKAIDTLAPSGQPILYTVEFAL